MPYWVREAFLAGVAAARSGAAKAAVFGPAPFFDMAIDEIFAVAFGIATFGRAGATAATLSVCLFLAADGMVST